MDKYIFCHFSYLQVSYKRNSYFYKKIIKVFLSKYGKNLMKCYICKIHVSNGFLIKEIFGLKTLN